ncbi:hypothetical protein [Flammeovirga sp. SJP92]|uniref:hypothetical protein n=1 Tax=Flammeovirga sp. SJP92 TaxID=1775430 RepID=UPI0012F99926|nr:hypothetical protein [Flammeovirga sp. SJP92]
MKVILFVLMSILIGCSPYKVSNQTKTSSLIHELDTIKESSTCHFEDVLVHLDSSDLKSITEVLSNYKLDPDDYQLNEIFDSLEIQKIEAKKDLSVIYQNIQSDCKKIEFLYYLFHLDLYHPHYSDKEIWGDLPFLPEHGESGNFDYTYSIILVLFYESRPGTEYCESLKLDLRDRLEELSCNL